MYIFTLLIKKTDPVRYFTSGPIMYIPNSFQDPINLLPLFLDPLHREVITMSRTTFRDTEPVIKVKKNIEKKKKPNV